MVVEENNLQVQVSALRKILGTDAIATTAGRGYRFTLELVPGGAPSASPVAQRHNLPPQLTSFIGHEDDLDECAALLDQSRLLTLDRHRRLRQDSDRHQARGTGAPVVSGWRVVR